MSIDKLKNVYFLGSLVKNIKGIYDKINEIIDYLDNEIATIASIQTTGVALTFIADSVYGTIGTPETGNITYSSINAELGVTNLIIHNHSIAPTFGTNMKKLSGSGLYVTGVVNYIYVTYINSTEVIYTINQRT